MLSKPEHGWSKFELGKEPYYELSYINDIPYMWIEEAKKGLKSMHPFIVRGFLEPWRMLAVVSFWNIHIFQEADDDRILNSDESCYEVVHMNMIEFCENLYNDINESLEEWVNWFCDEEIDLKKRRKMLEKELKELKELIEEKREYFVGPYAFL